MILIQRTTYSSNPNVLLTAYDIEKPILDFTFRVFHTFYCVPCYADSGSSASLISLQTARLLGLEIIPAPGESITAANGAELTIDGKVLFEISFQSDKFIPICALVTSNFDIPDGPINIISFSMLEKLGLMQLSHLATRNRTILKIPQPLKDLSKSSKMNLLTNEHKTQVTGSNFNAGNDV